MGAYQPTYLPGFSGLEIELGRSGRNGLPSMGRPAAFPDVAAI
jgi:hypothetical protein